MNVQQFQAKWRGATLKERSAAQEHFLDLCRLFTVPTPAEADPTGQTYTFEQGATKLTGGKGWADVWRRNYFAWEYKGQHADLDAAYRQLQLYIDDLENPPLLVVCDLDRFVVRTHFTGTPTVTYRFSLDNLDAPANLRILRAVFTDPHALRPRQTTAGVTEDAAARFGTLAAGLRARGVEPHRAAHFLVQLLFCLFAEDVGLLPKGIVSDLFRFAAKRPEQAPEQIDRLLHAMRDGGVVAFKEIARFNGGLFADVAVEPLTGEEWQLLAEAAALDWGNIEPAIFGTLFERSLDPGKRAQLGAHYTGRADIERVVEPVVMAPLRRRWDEVKAAAETLKAAWDTATTPAVRTRRRTAFANVLFAFQEELAGVRVLDPACGSGNFLYVALAALKDLEKAVIAYGTANGLPAMLPRVNPTQLYGLELNEYARELAQVVVWIGYLQWMTANGFQVNRDPVLEPLETIRLQDALLDRSDPLHLKEETWPAADVIIGNPPFLGAKRLRAELGDAYTDNLHQVFEGRLPPFSDLVCYFFEKARAEIAAGCATRAGLLATNSIRGGSNRTVLDRIKATGDIFMAWDDEPWILEGAAVRISIVGFDDGTEIDRCLDGQRVPIINADLTALTDLSVARPLSENASSCFLGVQLSGPFDLPGELARTMLAAPLNPNGRPNSDVIKPLINGTDITRRPRDVWIVDFGVGTPEGTAALYEAPFEYVKEHVKPMRAKSRSQQRDPRWWLTLWPRPEMRAAISPLARYLATPTVSKHRLFAWFTPDVLPNHAVVVFARDDDDFFGVLHSRAHELWSLRMGTWLGKGNDPRYTPTTCFETFPFPCPSDEQRAGIAAAAKTLDDQRRAWLDPPGAAPAELKKRTLTNLYNQRPAWLAHAHAALDRAVWAAYGWEDAEPATVEEDVILARLLALNLARAGEAPTAG